MKYFAGEWERSSDHKRMVDRGRAVDVPRSKVLGAYMQGTTQFLRLVDYTMSPGEGEFFAYVESGELVVVAYAYDTSG